MFRVQVTDFAGIKTADCMLPDRGAVVVSGINGAGKTSLLNAISSVMTQSNNALRLSATLRKNWEGYNGADPVVALTAETWSAINNHATSGELPTVHPFASGLFDVLEMAKKDRVELLETLLVPADVVTSELPIALAIALIGAHVSPEEAKAVLADATHEVTIEVTEIMEQLRGTQDWKGLAEVYADRRRLASRSWEHTVGEGTRFGKDRILTWRPHGWLDKMDAMTAGDAAADITTARKAVEKVQVRATHKAFLEGTVEDAKKHLQFAVDGLTATQDEPNSEWTSEQNSELQELNTAISAFSSDALLKTLDAAEKEFKDCIEANTLILSKWQNWVNETDAFAKWDTEGRQLLAAYETAKAKFETDKLQRAKFTAELDALRNQTAGGAASGTPCPACGTDLDASGKVLTVFVDVNKDSNMQVSLIESKIALLADEPKQVVMPEHPKLPGDEPAQVSYNGEAQLKLAAQNARNAYNKAVEFYNEQTQRRHVLIVAERAATHADQTRSNKLAGAEGRVTQAQTIMAAAEKALDTHEAPTDVEVLNVASRLETAEQTAKVVDIHLQARQHADDWLRANAVYQVLGINGWRSQRILDELNVCRATMAAGAKASDMKDIELTNGMELLYDGRPFEVLSGSEQFRCRTLFRVGLARATKSWLVIIDGGDILDGECLPYFVAAMHKFAVNMQHLILLGVTRDSLPTDLAVIDGVCVPTSGQFSAAAS